MKKLLFLLFIGVISLFMIVGFEERLGHVEVEWLGYRLETNVGLALLSLALGMIILLFLMRIIRSIFGFPSWLKERSALKHNKKIEQQLQNGLISYVMKDGETLALEAEGLMRKGGDQGLALFFRAEASVMKGDRKKAHELFLELSRLKGFEALGLNGLLKLALQRGGYEEVLYYVMACEQYYVSSPWLMDILFETALRFDKFEEAYDALKRKKSLKMITIEEYQSKVALVLLAQALKEQELGHLESYERLIEQSFESDESYLPTLLHFLPILLREEKYSRLRKIIERTWSSSPHPDLARLYAASMPEATDIEIYRLIQRLSSFAPHHPESRLEMARYALRAKLWGQAREYLEGLIDDHIKSPEIFFLRAQLEEAETGDPAQAWPWLEKMAHLNYQGNWFCRSCTSFQSTWKMICPQCHELKGLEWSTL